MRGERGLPGKREGLQTINMLISLCSPGAPPMTRTPASVFDGDLRSSGSFCTNAA